MLTNQDKQNIYDLLCQEFEKNSKIPLAKVALYLKNQGLNYEEFGYKKMKSLLNDLNEFLELSADETVGHKKEEYVVVHDFNNQGSAISNMIKGSPNKKGSTKFSNDDKKAIYESLKNGFNTSREYPMATISKWLLDHGFNYHAFGFSKMKSLLEAMPETISLRDVSIKGVKQSLVTIKERIDNASHPIINDKPLLKAEAKAPIKEKSFSSNDNSYPKAEEVFIPPKLILSVKEFTNLGLEDSSIVNLIKNDYSNDIKSNLITIKDDCFVFPLSFTNTHSEALIASIKKAANTTEYKYYLNFIGNDKEKPKDALRSQIFFPDFDDAVAELADLAIQEDWCYHHSKDPLIILKIYLQYTYYRLLSQKKVLVDEKSGFAAFNTGLETNDFDDIYGVLMVNKDKTIDSDYIFQGFSIAASQGIGKIIVEHFNPLPPKPTYTNSTADIIYDTKKDLHTDYQHIILDNLDRFPLMFLKKVVMPFAKEKKLLDDIIREKNDYQRSKLYAYLEEAVKENDMLFTLIKASLDSAIASSLKCVRYDYRMALPSFFPTRDVMSMMLPLVFDKGAGVEAILLVELTPSGNYQGQTILTLKQCYVNARLLGPLDNTFLKASDIED